MRDIRYAIRALLRTPAVTFTALLIMALGIGATTAIFSVANNVLFRPLPFANPERLVELGTVGVLEFQAYREHSRSFESLVSWGTVNKNLDNADGPERISAVAAERGLFDLLGVRPLAGRTFTPNDPADVAVVSEGFWRRRSGGRLSLDDWKIVLDRQPYTVIGVMPDSFQFPYRTTMTEVWIPTDLPRTGNWSQRIDVAVGRVRPDVTIDAAGAELRAIYRRVEPLRQSNADRIVPMMPLTEAVVGRSRTGVLTLLGAVAMVLLIACANVANLLLVRAEGRKREVAVRAALGAGRGRLFTQFLTESVVLALAASVAAVFIAIAVTRVLATLAASQIPRAFEIGLDWTAFLFLLTVAVGTGVAFGVVPALQAIRSDVTGMLNAASGRSSRGRGSVAMTNGLVVAEIALALILLTGAGLLLRALLFLEGTPTGIVAERVLTLRMETRGLLPQQAPAAETDSRLSAQGRYFRAIEDRVSRIAGVRAAGFVTRLHVQSPGFTAEFTVAGQSPPANGHGTAVRIREASPGYFRALGIPFRAGRMFTEGEPGIIVNETLVRRHFPAGVDPIGRVLSRGTIIGVVGDVRQRLRLPPEPEIYSPLARTGYSAATLVVSSSMPPDGLVGPVRSAIREINPNQTIFDVATMEQVIATSHADLDLFLWLIGGFAGLAFALSMAGIYGVLSYAVAARRKEFGIRLALGADAARVLRLVLAQGGLLVGTGVVVGIAGALALTRFLQALLYEVTPADPLTFTAATLALAGVAMAACLNPARRAMTVDPMTVLRHE
jgi:putative ABC transport system permease protein